MLLTKNIYDSDSEYCLAPMQLVGIYCLTLFETFLENKNNFKCSLESFYLGSTFKIFSCSLYVFNTVSSFFFEIHNGSVKPRFL